MRDILVYANNYRSFTPSMHYAAGIAKQFGAALNALYVQEPVTIVPSYAAMELLAEIRKFSDEQIAAAREQRGKFRAWATELGIESNDWMIVEAGLRQAMAETCNWHDLLVLGLRGENEWGGVAEVGEVLLTCGAPCIVVPEDRSPAARSRTIAVAWNGRPESVRAVHAALPLLRRAEHVVLIHGESVDPLTTLTRIPPFDVEAYLAQHGVRIEKRPLDVSDDRAGEALLAVAGEAQADLLVMGAYGRTRFSEWFFGGATRHVLEQATLPLFMRH
ncbi:MAG: universal stress protein [Proteobacteria bacterium]|uniref:universal stress protein n=1 Tax=Rudaea sp. TaxID=2136325 RepID=UPI0032204F90|nr:universal stress protein [Pseudomonadota bacterium]